MSPLHAPPEPLADHHELAGFGSRSAQQTEWLRRFARQSTNAGTTRVFVVTEQGRHEVVAYYAWCMAHLDAAKVPERLRKGAGRYPQPVALLARLGVDVDHEGRGLGAGLLGDVFARLLELSPSIGCRALVVHAESAETRDFYRHLVAEFAASPTDDLHLVVFMADIRRSLGGRS